MTLAFDAAPRTHQRSYSDNPAWTDERVELLKKFWAEGLSASQVACEIGVSRNAVIGKVHRLGLSHPPKRNATPKPRAPRAPRRKASLALSFNQPTATVIAMAEQPPAAETGKPLPGSRPRTLLELRENQCRWAVGLDEDGRHLFCGEPTPLKSSWCDAHADLAYPRQR